MSSFLRKFKSILWKKKKKKKGFVNKNQIFFFFFLCIKERIIFSLKSVGTRFSAQYHTVGGILDQRAQYNEFVESGLKG